MKSLRQLGAVLLVMLAAIAPALACATTASDAPGGLHACCQAVRESPCGMMQMQQTSLADCCVEPASPATHNAALATPALLRHTIALNVVRLSANDVADLHAVSIASGGDPQYAPSKAPPGAHSILRI